MAERSAWTRQEKVAAVQEVEAAVATEEDPAAVADMAVAEDMAVVEDMAAVEIGDMAAEVMTEAIEAMAAAVETGAMAAAVEATGVVAVAGIPPRVDTGALTTGHVSVEAGRGNATETDMIAMPAMLASSVTRTTSPLFKIIPWLVI